jgi:predicted DNA-binding protein
MPVFSPHADIPRPSDQWVGCDIVPVRIHLPARVVAQLEWLSERWTLNMATIAADVLVAVTSGRYLLAQLAAHHLQPQQGYRGSDTSVLNLQLLKPSLDLLEKVAVPTVDDLGHKCGQLVLNHMQGVLNPQLVSVALPDPDGEKLRKDDDSLTVHLPEELERKIEALADFYELTKSDVMRNCLLLHVYGRIRFELWTADGSWRPKRKATKEVVRAYVEGDAIFSRKRPYYGDDEPIKKSPDRRSEFIRKHGKSGDGARVFMPALLKDRLQELANSQGQKPSEYCRRTLVTLI